MDARRTKNAAIALGRRLQRKRRCVTPGLARWREASALSPSTGVSRGRSSATRLRRPSSRRQLTHLPTPGELRDHFERRIEREEYGRYGNPTQRIAEQKLAALEGAGDCLLFASGMAAHNDRSMPCCRTVPMLS